MDLLGLEEILEASQDSFTSDWATFVSVMVEFGEILPSEPPPPPQELRHVRVSLNSTLVNGPNIESNQTHKIVSM